MQIGVFMNNMKKVFALTLSLLLTFLFMGCVKTESTNTTISTKLLNWDGNSITYDASDISKFGSAIPSGMVNYDQTNDLAMIWNTDASLDNYGGVQTPSLTLDFSKAVIFQMEVESVYSEYIVKLAVEGESEYYYVLSDTNKTGLISINVVDSMLSDKYRTKNTQPDPGYVNGWIYDGQVKNCSFHVLAKGPDGEKQTAELVIKSITISNNQTPITGVQIISSSISDHEVSRLKASDSLNLSASVTPVESDNQEVFWTSSNPSVASVSEVGVVSFVNVGSAEITATSISDQSKSDSVQVNVLSGYENQNDLKQALLGLNLSSGSEFFMDLYHTAWNTQSSMTQGCLVSDMIALDYHLASDGVMIENYFDSSISSNVTEATQHLSNHQASINLTLSGSGEATVYRLVNGILSVEENVHAISVEYASYQSSWMKSSSYEEYGIVVWNDGTLKKYHLEVIDATLIGNYQASDLADSTKFTVPDRTLQALDPIVNALSPALVSVNGSVASLVQNKYPESKYCFGGIVSNPFEVTTGKDTTILLDVVSLNQMNDYVKTMWEIKVIYYQSDGITAVSSNPLKVASGYSTGLQVIHFQPAHSYFRIYLVVNGSDIGAQFSNATMGIDLLKLYQVNS